MKIRFVRDYIIGKFSYRKGDVIELTPHEVRTLHILAPGVFLPIMDGVDKHLSHPPFDRMMRQQVTK